MRNAIVILLLSVMLTLSGCALMDGLLLAPMRTPDGQVLYVDKTAEQEGDGLVLVTEDQMEKGRQYEIAYSDEQSTEMNALSGLLGLIPGWGTVASILPGFLVAGYAALRGRKKIAAQKQLADKWAALAKHGVKVIEALKAHKWDADSDGKIEASEVRDGIIEVVKGMGKDAADPEFLADVVRAMTGSFTETERQAILEEAVAALK